MKLVIVILSILIVSICGFERKSEEYKRALFQISEHVTKVFEIEYRNYVDTGVRSETLKALSKMLRPTVELRRREIENIALEEQATACILCRSAVNVILEYRREGKDNQFMFDLTMDICVSLHIQPQDVCEGLLKRNLPILLYIFDNQAKLTEYTICGVILQGSNCAIDDESFNWKIEIDTNGKEITGSKSEIPSGGPTDLTIVQITDVHFDPLYQTGALAECEEPLCCRRTDVKISDESKGAGKWGDYRDCDVPWYMYEDAVNQISKEHKKIDYIYFTGDIIDHGVWSTTNDGNRESIHQVNKYLKTVFPETKVFPLIGNHETNPLNVFAPDYIKDKDLTTQWLYDLLAEEWADWLPESALETVKAGGYYTVVPQKGFRIIALNNNDCYTFNFWILLDPQYLKKQLKWLHDTLLEAEKANEYVHILNHIPSGEGSCFNTWSREYRRIIDRFHNTISGIFVGHTHFDEFNVYYSKTNPSHAINVAWNGGSLTPFSFVNPNYRVYHVESQSFQVVDHDTWIYNLTLANINAEDNPVWYKEYSFKGTYELDDLSPASLNKLLHSFAADDQRLKSYWEYKVKSGDPSLKKGCDNDCLVGHLCEMAVTQSNDVNKCDELKEIFKETFLPSTTTDNLNEVTTENSSEGTTEIEVVVTEDTGAAATLSSIMGIIIPILVFLCRNLVL